MSSHEQSQPGITPRLDSGSDPVGDPDALPATRAARFKRPRHLKTPKPPRQPKAPKSSSAGARHDESSPLLAELMLLREENAWLKAAQHQAPGIGEAIQRVRALPADQAQPDDDREDDATQVLVEAHVLREALEQLCLEVHRTTVAIEARLADLAFREPEAPPMFEEVAGNPLNGTAAINVRGPQER